jgi:hypothetical protein
MSNLTEEQVAEIEAAAKAVIDRDGPFWSFSAESEANPMTECLRWLNAADPSRWLVIAAEWRQMRAEAADDAANLRAAYKANDIAVQTALLKGRVADQARAERDAAIKRAEEAERVLRGERLQIGGIPLLAQPLNWSWDRGIRKWVWDGDSTPWELAAAALRAAPAVPNDNATATDCRKRPESTTPCVGCEDVAGCER